MHKKLIILIAALVFVFGLATVSSAQVWGEIWYAGYVSKYATGAVDADTLIVLINPNTTRPGIKCQITVLDKFGVLIGKSLLYDGTLPTAVVVPGGYNWITLGQIVPPIEPTKVNWRIQCTGGPTPHKAPVVEVKEILYTQQVAPEDWKNPSVIRCWSETSLGGPTGTGYFPLGTQ
jgi:hypothetical protein